MIVVWLIIDNHRSALSLLRGSSIGSDDQIKRLLKGVLQIKAVTPKYSHTWDPHEVLNMVP